MIYLRIHDRDRVRYITMDRPEVHNAFDAALIRELTEAFAAAAKAKDVRAVVLAAEGKSFCAGADLNWMREAARYTYEQNVADAARLATMLKTVYDCPKPVIARVQGAAFGGGAGLVAACDLVAAAESATFAFSEVKLGLIPSVISPFVLRKLAPGTARRYFLTAERFSATTAQRIGLVSEVAATVEELDAQVETWTGQVRANGPEAMAACKRLIDDVVPAEWDRVLGLTAQRIAERRASAEGREGIQAFLEKREAGW